MQELGAAVGTYGSCVEGCVGVAEQLYYRFFAGCEALYGEMDCGVFLLGLDCEFVLEGFVVVAVDACDCCGIYGEGVRRTGRRQPRSR